MSKVYKNCFLHFPCLKGLPENTKDNSDQHKLFPGIKVRKIKIKDISVS